MENLESASVVEEVEASKEESEELIEVSVSDSGEEQVTRKLAVSVGETVTFDGVSLVDSTIDGDHGSSGSLNELAVVKIKKTNATTWVVSDTSTNIQAGKNFPIRYIRINGVTYAGKYSAANGVNTITFTLPSSTDLSGGFIGWVSETAGKYVFLGKGGATGATLDRVHPKSCTSSECFRYVIENRICKEFLLQTVKLESYS